MPDTVYLHFHESCLLPQEKTVRIKELAEISAKPEWRSKIAEIGIALPPAEPGMSVVISVLDVLRSVRSHCADVHIVVIGSGDIVAHIQEEKRPQWMNLCAILLVSGILFFGSAMAIMNFHADTNMPAVHRRIFYLLTGEEVRSPLVMQIPYSIGIGLGMLLFFNHLFRKKVDNEPTPLEVEMFLYRKNVERFILAQHDEQNENKR